MDSMHPAAGAASPASRVPIPPSPSPRRRWVTRGAVILLLAGLGWMVVGCLRETEAHALRRVLLSQMGGDWQQQVHVRIGPILCTCVRVAAGFLDLEPEVHQALSAIRGAEVAVYRPHARPDLARRSDALRHADEVMRQQDWDRVVAVIDGHDLVAVYAPSRMDSPRDAGCCVLVLDPEVLVVVSARADLQPLLELVRTKTRWPQRLARTGT